MNFNYLFFVYFGLMPSFVWLAYYLRKDSHPEPKSMITRVFLLGMLSSIPALFLELGFQSLLERFNLPAQVSYLLFIFVGIALVEELCKFLAVRMSVFSSSALDEPVDIMVYMVISALGFAALENILVLMGLGISAPLTQIAALSGVRFLGATFLHTLASAILGYFLALSYATKKQRIFNILKAFAFAILLHGGFNFYILESQGYLPFLIPLGIFLITAFFISLAFSRLKKMKSTCVIS